MTHNHGGIPFGKEISLKEMTHPRHFSYDDRHVRSHGFIYQFSDGSGKGIG